ncbi:hypothetical protein [Bartonella sp. LJL80]
MSSKRGGESIWIAYADMLTVLLMVFLLLSMLFQVIVATSKIAGPEDEVGNQQAKAPVDATTQAGDPTAPVSLEKTEDKESGAGDSQEAVKLPLVMVDTQVLQPRDGDLRLNIELSRTYITTIQQEQVRAWARQNREKLSLHKLRIYSVARSVGVSTGDVLSMQVNRVVATMAALRKENVAIKNILFDNLIVPDNAGDYLILRFEEANGSTLQPKR